MQCAGATGNMLNIFWPNYLFFVQPPCGPVKQAFLMLSTSKLADDEPQDDKTTECACEIITKKDELENIFEKLRSKVDTSI